MIALDTNVLVYAEAASDPSNRHIAAQELILRLGAPGAIVPLQVLAEFLNVCRRKALLSTGNAVERVGGYMDVFNIPETTPDDLLIAAQYAARYQLAYFDALICAVASRAGATVLLSEDMADGMEIDGLRIVNPFRAGNEGVIANLLG
ncbi:MAG: PIN domain-containing protein [Alphaproteobacteria bacterium]|nr:PIN domain-containing protein [Alphaproteobacteria bacterium]